MLGLGWQAFLKLRGSEAKKIKMNPGYLGREQPCSEQTMSYASLKIPQQQAEKDVKTCSKSSRNDTWVT